MGLSIQQTLEDSVRADVASRTFRPSRLNFGLALTEGAMKPKPFEFSGSYCDMVGDRGCSRTVVQPFTSQD